LPSLGQNVAAWCVEQFEWRQTAVSVRPLSLGIFERLFRSRRVYVVDVRERTSGKRASFVLKTYDNRELAAEEFRILSELNHHFRSSSEGFGVPTPMGLLQDIPGLLMQLITGKRLDRIVWPLFPNRRSRQVAAEAVRKAATWLAIYHKMACPEEDGRQLPWDSPLGRARSALARCSGNGLPQLAVKTIERWILAAEDRIDDKEIQRVPTCPDAFAPDHIFVSNLETSVIDFEWHSCGWQAEDLADFLLYFELKSTFPPPSLTFEEYSRHLLQSYTSGSELGLTMEVGIDACFLVGLMETFLAPRHMNSATFREGQFVRWKSRIAKDRIMRRSRSGEWECAVGRKAV